MLLGLASAAIGGCRTEAPRYVLDLGGEQRFHRGDDPGFASPAFDDRRWERLATPATWRAAIRDDESVGWHRIRFEVPEGMSPARLALDLGPIGWSDETYLDGHRIGATGRPDRVPSLGWVPRLYPVPARLLTPGEHVLAIRVRGLPMMPGGLFAERIGIGGELELGRAQHAAMSRTMAAEGVLLGFFGFAWMLVAFFPKRGRAGRATLFLLGAITAEIVHFGLVSRLGRQLGGIPPVGAHVVYVVVGLGACGAWAYVAILTRGVLTRPVIGLIAVALVMCVIQISWPGAMAPLVIVSHGLAIVAWVTMASLLAGAMRARTPGAIPFAAGVGVLVGLMVTMASRHDPFVSGVALLYYGLAAASAGAILALTRHVGALDGQAQRATEYALLAHTRERQRLSRDLHDGLGQMLALLKMQLQRLGRKHEGESVQQAFDDGAQAVAATLDELRRIARDLRPAPMQDRGLGEAVREYAAALAQRTDLDVVVNGDLGPRPPRAEVADELYRIAQECLTNCLKHSGARRVVVTLTEVGDRYRLVVLDDGRGLPAPVPVGLGLSTIRERTALLGGTCRVASPPEGGTCVEVSVPR